MQRLPYNVGPVISGDVGNSRTASRLRSGPVFRSLPRDWPAEQMAILESAEEYSLLEEYKFALAAREKKIRARQSSTAS